MTTTLQPLNLQERVEILDLLRGIALFGILMVNMPLMNAPFATEMGKFALWTDPLNSKARWFIDFFFTGKFYTLFSMLFGIGFYFFLKKSEKTGNSVIPLFRKRLGWLLAIGVLHVVLLWYGDILVFYALFGFIMILFRKKSNKSLIIWAISILLLPPLFASLLALAIQAGLSNPEIAVEMQASFAEAEQRLSDFMDQAIQIYAHGSFTQIVAVRLEEYSNILGGIFFFFPNVLAMFLVGMVLARKKVFEDIQTNKPFFKKLLYISLPFAIVGNGLYAHYAPIATYIAIDWKMVVSLIGHGFGGPAMTFVYISLIVLCHQRGYFTFLSNVIKKTGRMALTNYLAQSLIATTLFFSYGFGLYGKINLWQGILITVAIYAIQVIWSHYWLQHYRYGPMEWLWRTLTYGKKQKMKLVK